MKQQTIKIVLAGMFFAICSFSLKSQTLAIKIFNKTAENVDSLSIGNRYIGSLARDSVTSFLDFDKISFDSDTPIEPISGIIRELPVIQLDWSHCGTMWHTETKGKYILDLELRNNEDVIRFVLLPHR
jgi:hypothetical protein